MGDLSKEMAYMLMALIIIGLCDDRRREEDQYNNGESRPHFQLKTISLLR